jgi:hypothetical protein
MVLKLEMHENNPLHIQKLNCGKNVYELEDLVGEELLSLNLSPKLGIIGKILLQGFPVTC